MLTTRSAQVDYHLFHWEELIVVAQHLARFGTAGQPLLGRATGTAQMAQQPVVEWRTARQNQGVDDQKRKDDAGKAIMISRCKSRCKRCSDADQYIVSQIFLSLSLLPCRGRAGDLSG